MNGAVLRTGEDHFRVVLVGHDEHHTQALACVYSSWTRQWGSVISAPIPPVVSIVTEIPGVLAGDSLYWLSSRNPDHPTPILEFNLGTQSLAAIQLPVNMYGQGNHSLWVMRAQDGGLGFLFLWGTDAQLWKRTGDGAANSWVITKTIQMDKLLSLSTEEEKRSLSIEGLVEDRNVVFFRTAISHFMVHLESLWPLRCKELSETDIIHVFHPFTSVYTADNSTTS
uniref:F-box protein AT5G49610-like beta-propeller domain-containing protein n=1 Tax=Aegilops tauschii TaxID=37682 RepID=N1QTM9_AEGTA